MYLYFKTVTFLDENEKWDCSKPKPKPKYCIIYTVDWNKLLIILGISLVIVLLFLIDFVGAILHKTNTEFAQSTQHSSNIIYNR